MKIEYLTQPFEHVIIKDFYNAEELSDVMKEIEDVLGFSRLHSSASRRYFQSSALSNSAMDKTGNVLSNRIAFGINELLKGTSKTFAHTKKIFLPPLSDELVENSNLCKFLKTVNTVGVVVGVYGDNTSYKPHFDSSILSIVGHLWKNESNFNGGELYFPEYNNYSIVPEFNKFTIFPSHEIHGVKLVSQKNKEDELLSMRISITMLTNITPERKPTLFRTNKEALWQSQKNI